MNSKKQKEEFYSKDETEEFVCENYFLNEPLFMKEAINNAGDRENQCENFPQHFNDLGINNDKISLNMGEIKKETSNCLNQNEALKFAISDMTSQADTNYQNKFGKNSKPNSHQSHSSLNNNPTQFHHQYNTNRQKNISNQNNANLVNNYNLNTLTNNQNNQNLLELLISNRLIDDLSIDKEKLLTQKKNRPVENTTSTKMTNNYSANNNNKLLNMIVNSINQNLNNDQFYGSNQGNVMMNDNGNNIHNLQNKGAFNYDLGGNSQSNLNMQLLESYINNTKQNPESGENKILKSLLVNKVNDILLNSNLSEKLILYNMITNSNYPNNMSSKNESSMNLDQNNKNLLNFMNILNSKPNASIPNSSINNNSNIKQQNINFNIPQNTGNSHSNNFNGSFPSKSDIMEKYINNEVIRCTIENFCKFLFANGYCIVSNNKLNNNLSQNSFFQNLLQNNFNLDYYNNKYNNSNPNGSNEFSNSNQLNDADDSVKKKTKDIINCPHTDRKHYAKNMCNNCYHKQGRVKKAWLCSHTNRPHYARGKCQNCYLNFYHKEQIQKKKEKKGELDENKDESNLTVPHDDGSFNNFRNSLNSESKVQPAPSSEGIDTNGEK